MVSTFLPCFLCGISPASHRITLPVAGARWICDPCDPCAPGLTPPARQAERMADVLVLAHRRVQLDLYSFRRCCEQLHSARFYGADIVDRADRAMALARQRIAAGELAHVAEPAAAFRPLAAPPRQTAPRLAVRA